LESADVENLYICESETGVVGLKEPYFTPNAGSDVEKIYI
jgi:hypothetical protein